MFEQGAHGWSRLHVPTVESKCRLEFQLTVSRVVPRNHIYAHKIIALALFRRSETHDTGAIRRFLFAATLARPQDERVRAKSVKSTRSEGVVAKGNPWF